MTTTNEWEDAARQAAEDICDNVWIPDNEIPQFQERISKHFAELREVHSKLVELAVQLDNEYPIRELISDDGKCYETYDTLSQPLRAILNDPHVVAAIERSKG